MKTPERDTHALPLDDDPSSHAEHDSDVLENPWRSIDDAPRDRIIEGRIADEEVGQPIRWRASRRRVGHQWVDGGVWHSADLRGAVELHPVEWREFFPAPLRFDPPDESVAA